MKFVRLICSLSQSLLLCMLIATCAVATPEPLAPVPFSHTVTIPYGGSLTEQTATAIAEALALHGAYNRAARWLSHRRELALIKNVQPSLGTKDELLIAAQLYRSHRSNIFRSADIDHKYINVEVTATPVLKFDDTLLRVIQPTSRTRIFEAVFNSEASYLKTFSDVTFKDKQNNYLLGFSLDKKHYFDTFAAKLTALKAYRKLIPEYSNGMWNDPKAMLKTIEKLLVDAPEEPVLLHAKGTALFQLKDTIGAIKNYSNALEFSPELVVALHDRGTAYVRAGLADMGLVDYDLAIKLSPDNAHLFISHGSADLMLNDYKTMCANYRKGCTLGLCDELHWAISRKLCTE